MKEKQSRAEQSRATETRDNVSLSPQQSLNFADMMSLVGERTNNLSSGLALNPNGPPQQALPLAPSSRVKSLLPKPLVRPVRAFPAAPTSNPIQPAQLHPRFFPPLQPHFIVLDYPPIFSHLNLLAPGIARERERDRIDPPEAKSPTPAAVSH
ncbi:hypothetical protein LA080_001173 [Diaporthe eres]|nr:hypothetical protein LA080_001173 [Diaporthe eres]